MTGLPSAQSIRRAPLDIAAHDHVALAHHERLLRRRRLVTPRGEAFLVDLPRTTGVTHGDAFELADGRLIAVIAAEEALMEVRGDLFRLAWHIGNRHAPCQIEPDRFLILRDAVLRGMLVGLGATVRDVTEPFHPEGGAYGEGTPMGHSHGDDDLALGGLAHDPL